MHTTSANHADFSRTIKAACLASVGMLSLCAAPAWAQTAAPDPSKGQTQVEPQVSPETPSAGVDDIVVTARREAENQQNVPVSVQVVTGTSLQKLAITSVEEVSKLAPGLTLVNAGSSTAVTLRGVTWQPGSGTPATPIYLNEVPFDPASTIASLYDVGQIEVLRGPQGTTRGAPSISGAVTISTRKPDLYKIGGYIQGQYGSANHKDVQGAINIPLIKDVLAVRFAANIEDSEGSRIYSVTPGAIKPYSNDRSYRGTVLFKPTDAISIEAMYSRRRTISRLYTQVAGTGSPGSTGIPGLSPTIPANYNGPALTTSQRASVQDQPGVTANNIDLLTLNASWELHGHVLSYNFGRQWNTSRPTLNANDPLNIVPGFEPFTVVTNLGSLRYETHEIRLSSLTDENRPFDYDIGWFSKHSGGRQNFGSPAYLAGAFGNPATAVPGQVTVPVPRYVLGSSTNILLTQTFDSFYGNVRFHIDPRTELSGGLSIVRDRVEVGLDIQTFAAAQNLGNLSILKLAFPAPFQPLVTSCEVFGAFAGNPSIVTSPTYAGTCDFNIPNGFRNSTQYNNNKYSDALYNFSLSHKFTDDILVYATTGTSFRTGLPAINNPGLPTIYTVPKPETATSYEIGVKASFGRRLRVNVSAFQLDYDNQLTAFEGIQYFNTVTNATAQTSLAFYSNINARVRGIEAEIAAKPLNNLSLGANISYSQIKSKGGNVPCNDATRPINAANPINICASANGQVLNQQAPFQATVNGGYDVPFNDSLAGYFRFNVNYTGKNPNFGNFRSGTSVFKSTPEYAVVDLFAGLTAHRGAWDLGVYAKNVFDKQVELARVATINSVYSTFAAPSGYDVVRASRPREIGVQLRVAFGSR